MSFESPSSHPLFKAFASTKGATLALALLNPLLPITVDCKVGSPDQQHRQQLGTCQKLKFSAPAPDLLSEKLWGLGEQSFVY